MAQDMPWLESHIGSIEKGIELINQLRWHLDVKEPFVMAGDQVIFRSDDREVIDAFIYGMALAYSVIPENAFDALKHQFESNE